MNFLKHFFINSFTLLISGLITIILFICHSIYYIANIGASQINIFLAFDFAFIAILIIILLIRYKEGVVSYQKALLSSILTAFLFTQILLASGNIVLGVYSVNFEAIMTVLFFIIFINYFYLQIDQKGEREIIKINFAVFVLTCIMLLIKLLQNFMYSYSIFDYLWTLEFLSFMIMLICIEARITKYRIVRFEHKREGTWTMEEKEKQKSIFKI